MTDETVHAEEPEKHTRKVLKVRFLKRPRLSHYFRLNWQSLKRWGKSRVVKSSYLWLLLVPICARVLEPFPETFTFHIFGSEATIAIGLPFTWQVLYLAAFLYAVGQFIYVWACPFIVHEYENYNEYRETQIGTVPLAKALLSLVAGASHADANEHIRTAQYTISEDIMRCVGTNPDAFPSPITAGDTADALKEVPIPRDVVETVVANVIALSRYDEVLRNDLFDRVYEAMTYANRLRFWFSAVLFVSGSLLVLGVLIQGFFSVFGG